MMPLFTDIWATVPGAALVIGLAFVLDLLLGDPVYFLHPVRLIGNWISKLEKIFFSHNLTGIFHGVALWFLAVIPVCGLFAFIDIILQKSHFPFLPIGVEVFVVYSCFAFRDMIDHVKPIYNALAQNNLPLARDRLKRIVGRDVGHLEEEGIVRAGVESMAESFVDGFLSPMFWFALGVFFGKLAWPGYEGLFGPGAMLVYRITNTLDSMVGYKNDIYEKFGKFSARMDDAMNFIPARLSLFFILPGIVLSCANPVKATKIFFRDRHKSQSPNAAHPMSIFAGALGISLGGRAYYGGEILNKPVLGDSQNEIKKDALLMAVNIYLFSGLSVGGFLVLIMMRLI